MMTGMSEEDSPAIDDKVNRGERDRTATWVRRGVMILVAIVAVFIVYKIAASVLPREWAQRVGRQVDGSLTKGTLWGLFYGFVFSFVPLLLLVQVRRKFLNWKAKVVVAVIAIALATPNWLTLSVVVGNSKAAHAGERTFDVNAPGFRSATLIGVVVGVVMALAIAGASIQLAHRRKQVRELKQQVKQQKAAKDEPHDEPGDD